MVYILVEAISGVVSSRVVVSSVGVGCGVVEVVWVVRRGVKVDGGGGGAGVSVVVSAGSV